MQEPTFRGEIRVQVNCSGAKHTIIYRDGSVLTPDHGEGDYDRAFTLAELAGKVKRYPYYVQVTDFPRCFEVVGMWEQRPPNFLFCRTRVTGRGRMKGDAIYSRLPKGLVHVNQLRWAAKRAQHWLKRPITVAIGDGDDGRG